MIHVRASAIAVTALGIAIHVVQNLPERRFASSCRFPRGGKFAITAHTSFPALGKALRGVQATAALV